MRLLPRQATSALIFLSFLLVAIAQSWPLALNLTTHLTGPPGGDTGVYVWNTWVFRRELLELGRQPYSTDAIFWSGLPANLGLHNYTPFADLLAALLQPAVGVVGAFNLIYLLNTALAGLGMYLLASRHTPDRGAAWLAGLLFSCSPFLVARSLGHFSLAAAAPLPFFMWQLERVFEKPTAGRAVAAGAFAAWAAMSDPYYAVYCLMLATAMAGARFVRIDTASIHAHRRLSRADVALLTAAIAIAALGVWRISELQIGGVRVTMRTLYTPVLIVSCLAVGRTWRRMRPSFCLTRRPSIAEWRAAGWMLAASALLLAPWLVALGRRVLDGTVTSAPVLWRSSMGGVDLLSLFLPNPVNPFLPTALRTFTAALPGGFVEQVASLPLAALIVIGVARWRGARMSRFWTAMALFFAVLALGPFVRIGGINTYIPTPWALLRYVPIIDQARAPTRFSVVAVMAVAVIFAQAFAQWRGSAARRDLAAAVLGALLCIELVPAPRALYSADVPSIYKTVAADRRNVGLLELPFGLRDGVSSLGDFTPQSQYFQTVHHKPLYGGYLSRISDQRKTLYQTRPVLGALMALSEGKALTAEQSARARAGAASFTARTNLGYVVIDQSRATTPLRAFAIETLKLRKIGASGSRELYAPMR